MTTSNASVNNSVNTSVIQSSDGIHQLHHTFFTPKQPIKATLLIVHGMAEHSGRYEKFANFLAEQGIAVLTYDHLGHGKTMQDMKNLGYVAKKHPVQKLLQDVVIMADALKDKHPDVPHFIMGHSMGSFIVRNVLAHHSSSFSGAILMGTAHKDPLIKALLPVFSVLNKVAPKSPCSWGAVTMNKQLNVHFKSETSDFAWVSKNTDNIEAYQQDPLCGFVFTNNGFFALFNLMDVALNKNWFEHIRPEFPMLLVSGNDDPIGKMGKGISKLEQHLNKQGFTSIDKKLYQGMRHEPLNEDNHQMVFQDIVQWLINNSPNNS